jgi:type II secretory ATPase GspE/PulE/Tfp pilus assembly ATPase PilB-like protein
VAKWFEHAGLSLPRMLPQARGCDRCHGRGYRGRIALFELAGSTADAPAPFAAGSLGAAGLAHVLEGRTTVEEVLVHCPHSSGDEVAP